MGFGHRVYKNYDPRARIIKRVAYEVFEVMGRNPLLDIALECERIALEDDYFVTRKLYPNVDFYTGLIYQSMGFPVTMFPVLFAIPRTSRAGSRSGKRCCSIPSRRSRARARSTWATISAATSRPTIAANRGSSPTLSVLAPVFRSGDSSASPFVSSLTRPSCSKKWMLRSFF